MKLASVCSDVLGKTGRAILDALLANKAISQEAVTEMAKGQLKKKTTQLLRAVEGTLTQSTRLILAQMIGRLALLRHSFVTG